MKAPQAQTREERVHAFSPEERAEIQSIVRSTVDRAIAPILDIQRKLQQRLDAERTQPVAPAPPPPLPVAVAPPPPVAIAPPPPPVAVAPPVAIAAAPVEAELEIPVFVEELPPDLDDLEWQWSGARRRRVLAWTFGALAALALAAMTAAAMLSQSGHL